MNKALIQFEFKGMTKKQFDQIWQDLKAAGQSQPKGLQHHFASATAQGMVIIDVWESADRFKEFGKVLMPILEKNRIPKTQPVITPLHFEYNAKMLAL